MLIAKHQLHVTNIGTCVFSHNKHSDFTNSLYYVCMQSRKDRATIKNLFLLNISY